MNVNKISMILAIIFQEHEYRHAAAATFKLQLGIGHAFS